jgi:hypothetical protein
MVHDNLCIGLPYFPTSPARPIRNAGSVFRFPDFLLHRRRSFRRLFHTFFGNR